MAKNDFKDYVCRPYCIFFKEGHKEEMSCRGAEVVEKLVLLGQINTDALPHFKKDSRLWQKYTNIIGENICVTCPFRAEDCNFMSEDPEAKPYDEIEPCGGFIMLALLIENDLINIAGLEKGL